MIKTFNSKRHMSTSVSDNQDSKLGGMVNWKKNMINIQGIVKNESCSLWKKNNVLSN
jgi:hypothetical protein